MVAAACTFPEFDFDPIPTDDDQSTSTAPSTGGAGGLGASNSMASTSTSGNNDGGSGAAGPQPCVLTSVGTCGSGKKCSIVNTATGDTGCVDAGFRPAFAVCLEDTECAEGTFCDGYTSVCKPFCDSDLTCGAGFCVSATSDTDIIEDAFVCTAHCNPLTVAPCALTGVTCFWDGELQEFDCAASLGKSVGDECEFANHCAGGLLCFKEACDEWCTIENSQCPFLEYCAELPYEYDVKVGVCIPVI